jgi:hypothetical protein
MRIVTTFGLCGVKRGRGGKQSENTAIVAYSGEKLAKVYKKY